MPFLVNQPVHKAGDPGTWPTPPKHLMEYGEPPERHLEAGRREYHDMHRIVGELGYDLDTARRILDFGCSNGRVTRWVPTKNREVWGSDIQSEKVYWALENIGPPIRFLSNSTFSHLPFPDKYFDFVFAQSIFTHLPENHIAWMLELLRLIKPEGALYITLHDRACLETAHFKKYLAAQKFHGMDKFAPDIEKVGFISMNEYKSGSLSQVYMTIEHLRRILPPGIVVKGPIVGAYAGAQSGYLITRR